MDKQSCRFCGGHLIEKRVNRIQEYRDTWVIIENLPALVCEQCGETYYTPQVHDQVVMLLQGQHEPARVEAIKVYDATKVS